MAGPVNLRVVRQQMAEVIYWRERVVEPWVVAMDNVVRWVPAMVDEMERLRRQVALLECNEVRPFAHS